MDVTEPPHVVGSMDKMRAAEISRRNDFITFLLCKQRTVVEERDDPIVGGSHSAPEVCLMCFALVPKAVDEVESASVPWSEQAPK